MREMSELCYLGKTGVLGYSLGLVVRITNQLFDKISIIHTLTVNNLASNCKSELG